MGLDIFDSVNFHQTDGKIMALFQCDSSVMEDKLKLIHCLNDLIKIKSHSKEILESLKDTNINNPDFIIEVLLKTPNLSLQIINIDPSYDLLSAIGKIKLSMIYFFYNKNKTPISDFEDLLTNHYDKVIPDGNSIQQKILTYMNIASLEIPSKIEE